VKRKISAGKKTEPEFDLISGGWWYISAGLKRTLRGKGIFTGVFFSSFLEETKKKHQSGTCGIY
jgi:hypothetical protein